VSQEQRTHRQWTPVHASLIKILDVGVRLGAPSRWNWYNLAIICELLDFTKWKNCHCIITIEELLFVHRWKIIIEEQL
jgi:hypothetical protein